MLERMTRSFLLSLLVVCTIATAPDLAAALTISGTFHFRGNEGPNTLGLVVGDRQSFGANAVDPAGPPTVVQASQGLTTLPIIDQTAFTPARPYARSIPFDPTLTGSWFIEAFRGADSAVGSRPRSRTRSWCPWSLIRERLVPGSSLASSGTYPTWLDSISTRSA